MSVMTIVLALFGVGCLGVFSWKRPRLSSILIWSLVATTLVSTVALMTLPYDFASKAQWLSFLVPLILVGFQYWCYWSENARRVLFALIILSVLSGGVVIAIDPII